MKSLTKVMSISVFVNIFLAIIKVLFGTLLKSHALVADGIHSFSDLITDLFAIIGNHLSMKPADHNHPYGHGKIEYVTSIVIGFVILMVGFEVISNSFKQEIVVPGVLVLIVSIITIISKLILSEYIIRQGKKHKNNILIASGEESRTDVISSIVVLVSIVFMQLSSKYSIFMYSDKIASVIVGIFIIYAGFSIIRENMSNVLGVQEEDEEYLLELKKAILFCEEIVHIDSLVLLKFGSVYKLNLTVSMDGGLKLREAHQLMDQMEDKIKIYDPKIAYITVHMEPNEEP